MSPSWRPIPEPSEPRPVAESLDRIRGPFGRLFARWPELVGETVAAHSQPRALRDGRLLVTVDDPAWATQLRWLEADLLRRFEDLVGDARIAAVDVRVGPLDQSR